MAGSGFNIIYYCCGACESKGIEYIAQYSCHEVHEDENIDCCGSTYHSSDLSVDYIIFSDLELKSCDSNSNHCDVKRIQFDDFSISKTLNASLFPTDFQTITFLESFFLLSPSIDNSISYLANSPPRFSLLEGRDILCKKAVLII